MQLSNVEFSSDDTDTLRINLVIRIDCMIDSLLDSVAQDSLLDFDQ
jgi:hypothetical protein